MPKKKKNEALIIKLSQIKLLVMTMQLHLQPFGPSQDNQRNAAWRLQLDQLVLALMLQKQLCMHD